MTRIGTSDLDVFPLCLGGNVFGWTADRDESFAILDAFTEGGGDFVDTADGYSAWVPGNTGGDSERIIGAWLAARPSAELTIATKVSRHPDFPGLKNIRGAAEASLQRLGVETIDLLQFHWWQYEHPAYLEGAIHTHFIEEHAEALEGLLPRDLAGSEIHRHEIFLVGVSFLVLLFPVLFVFLGVVLLLLIIIIIIAVAYRRHLTVEAILRVVVLVVLVGVIRL